MRRLARHVGQAEGGYKGVRVHVERLVELQAGEKGQERGGIIKVKRRIGGEE